MTTMVERLARAIDPIAWDDGPGGMPTAKARAAWEFDRAVSLTQAQAVLREMLVPSRVVLNNVSLLHWQAAIQAAIDEGEGL